jgi:hypothetical protein
MACTLDHFHAPGRSEYPLPVSSYYDPVGRNLTLLIYNLICREFPFSS